MIIQVEKTLNAINTISTMFDKECDIYMDCRDCKVRLACNFFAELFIEIKAMR